MDQQIISKQSTFSIKNLFLRLWQFWLTCKCLIFFICLMISIIAICWSFQQYNFFIQKEIALRSQGQTYDDFSIKIRNLGTDLVIKQKSVGQKGTKIFKKPYNIQEYEKLVELFKKRKVEKTVFKTLDRKPQIIFPYEKYQNVPIQKLLINGMEIEMHHEILPVVEPTVNSSYFRRSISHRYSFAVSGVTSAQTLIIQSQQNILSFIQQNILSTPDHTQLCKKFYYNGHIQNYKKSELLYSELKYRSDIFVDELPICVVGTGKNILSRGLFMDFFRSVSKQNYTNYHVVVIDDGSVDGSIEGFIEIVDKYFGELKGRIVFIRNQNSLGAFNNKDFGIKENCNVGDIVVEVDLDDGLIGRQVFKILNAEYQTHQELQVIYSDFLIYNNKKGSYWRGLNQGLSYEEWLGYRGRLKGWKTGHLKSYRRSLYVLVPLGYLADLQNIGENGEKYPIYGRYTSDQYMMISMIELAGFGGFKFVDEIFYLYRKGEGIEGDAQCHVALQFYQELKGRIKIPLERGEDGKVSFRQDYEINEELMKVYQDQENFVRKSCLFYLEHPFENGENKKNFVFAIPGLKDEAIFIGQIYNLMSVAVVSSGRAQLLSRTLESFFSGNTFPITKIVVIWDNKQTQQFLELKKKYEKIPQLIWLRTDVVVGQLKALDLVFQEIDSKYVFICEDNVVFEQGGFLKNAVSILQGNKDVGQVVFKGKSGGWFQLGNGVQRVGIYGMIGSYGEFTKNVTYGKSGSMAEPIISEFYFQKGIKVENIQKRFFKYVCDLCTKWPIFYVGEDAQIKQQEFEKKYLDVVKKRGQKFLEMRKEMDLKDQGLDFEGKWLWVDRMDGQQNGQKFGINFMNSFDIFQVFYRKEQLHNGNGKNMRMIGFNDNFEVKTYEKDFGENLKGIGEQELCEMLLRKDERSDQIEYGFYGWKYEIDGRMYENRMCIVIVGFQQRGLGELQDLILSIGGQNYGDYHVEIISHLFYGISGMEEKIIRMLDGKQFKDVKQKIRLWKSFDEENVAKIWVGVEKVCGMEDIVVVVNGGRFIGQQALGVINAHFQDKGVWLMGSRKVMDGKIKKKQLKIHQNNRIQNDQLFENTFWSFRSELMRHVPLYHLTYYDLDLRGHFYSVKFDNSFSMKSIYVSMVELSGNGRVRLIDDFIFKQERMNKVGVCVEQRDGYVLGQIGSKRIVRGLKMLRDDGVSFNFKYRVPQGIVKFTQGAYEGFMGCLVKLQQNGFQMENLQKKQDRKQLGGQGKSEEKRVGQLVEESVKKMEFPEHYVDIYKVGQFDFLPFCLVVLTGGKSKQQISQIQDSIKDQNYPNVTIVLIESLVDYSWMSKGCPEKCLVIFLKSVLKKGGLLYLNEIHQVYNVWMSYSVDVDVGVGIHTGYLWVFKLLERERKDGAYGIGVDVLRIIRFCQGHGYRVERGSLIEEDAYFKVQFSDRTLFDDEMVKQFEFGKERVSSLPLNTPRYVVLKQVQYQQLVYLPPQHSLFGRKKLELQFMKKEQIRKYEV